MAFRAGMKGSMEPQGGFGLDRLRLLVVFGCFPSPPMFAIPERRVTRLVRIVYYRTLDGWIYRGIQFLILLQFLIIILILLLYFLMSFLPSLREGIVDVSDFLVVFESLALTTLVIFHNIAHRIIGHILFFLNLDHLLILWMHHKLV
jgi:hypothetical protein